MSTTTLPKVPKYHGKCANCGEKSYTFECDACSLQAAGAPDKIKATASKYVCSPSKRHNGEPIPTMMPHY